MGPQVTLPAVGPVSKKALWIGGGGAVLLMGVLWYRKRSTAAATPLDPTDPNATDTTGLDTTGSGVGAGAGNANLPQVGTPTSNPQWTALVMQQLDGTTADPTALAAALGRYLTGQSVTTDQELLIDEAIAAAGYPPVDGPNGYPPAIHTQPATGQTPPPAQTPSPAPGPAPAPGPTRRYTIQHGDTLSGIAAKFGTSKAQLLAWNLPDLDAYARKFNHPNSNNGNLIFGGLPIWVG